MNASMKHSPASHLDYLRCLGPALIAVGRPADAVLNLERAVELAEPDNIDPLTVATMRFELARALAMAQPAERERSVQLANDALSFLSKSESPTEAMTERITAWLRTHAT